MHIEIGMKRERMRKLAEELLDATLPGGGVASVEIDGELNDMDSNESVMIVLSNDDMERNDVPADAVLVDVYND